MKTNKLLISIIFLFSYLFIYICFLLFFKFEFKEYKQFENIIIKRKIWNFPHFHDPVGRDTISITKNEKTIYIDVDYIKKIELKNNILHIYVIKRGANLQEDRFEIKKYDIDKLFE